MSESKRQTDFCASDLTAELKKMVGESLQSTTSAFLRSLNLFKTAATSMPGRKLDALDIAKRWARINLETSLIVSRHSQEAVSEILDALEHFGLIDSEPEQAPGVETNEKPIETVVIKLNAKRGQKATALFAVSNPGPKTMAATFTVSDFINEDGHVVKNVAAAFSPAELKLLPDQETAVEIAIEISAKFRVDKCYRSAIQIPEYPGKKIMLELQVNRAKGTQAARSGEKKA